MADTKITALTALTAADPANDVIPIVDVSDTSMAASGTTKKISVNNILGASGTATLASATITGDLTVDTNVLKVDTANNRVGIGTASPLYSLVVNGTDTTNVLFNGITKGVRFNANASGSVITGVDNTGSVSFQPLTIGGSTLDFALSGTTAMTLNSTGLGVGASPGEKLEVAGNVRSSAWIGRVNGSAPTADCAIYRPTDNAIAISTANTERVRVDVSGNVGIGVTPAGTGGCLQLKSGITFPATQVASSDVNTLDDYEEGTWTGTLKGSVSDPTIPVTATGAYTKVGRLVTVTIRYINVVTTGASGDVTITGLPFSGAENSAGSAIAFSMFTTSTTLACWNNGTTIAFYVSGAFTPATHSAGVSRSVTVTITYYV